MTFREKLHAAVRQNHSLLCVGLDPDPARLPVADVLAFHRAIIDATADLVCAYKPNSAFFEALGADGWRLLKQTIEAIPSHIPVILDAKRGDVGNTARAYAQAAFGFFNADAVTVSPYLGHDAVAPFLEWPERAALVLCRTSNPGAPDLQDLLVDGEPLYLRVADLARQWSAPHHNGGLVVGATYPGELAAVRARCPDLPILLPGVGAQGGDLEASVRAGLDARGAGLLVSASRSVLYAAAAGGHYAAAAGGQYPAAARAEALRLRDAINAVRAPQETPR